MGRQVWLQVFLAAVAVLSINVAAHWWNWRLDLTEDRRFTLTGAVRKLLSELDDDVYVTVYLAGSLPAQFKKFQDMVRTTLQLFRQAALGRVHYRFVDPYEEFGGVGEAVRALRQQGVEPVRVQVRTSEGSEERVVFAGAVVSYQTRTRTVNLLEYARGTNPYDALNEAMSQLEYVVASAVRDLMQVSVPKVGVVIGVGEPQEVYLAAFLERLQVRYRVVKVPLREVLSIEPGRDVDVLLVIKPSEVFSEKDKFKLDQYLMRGGKLIWMVDAVDAHLDSLRGRSQFVAMPLELNIEDLLFKWGIRIAPALVQDLNCAPIPIVVGYMGNVPQQVLMPWVYFPVAETQRSDGLLLRRYDVLLRFASPVDTVPAEGTQTKKVLLATSAQSRRLMAPVDVSLSAVRLVETPGLFTMGSVAVGVLAEGSFVSAYRGRLSPETIALLDSLGTPFLERSRVHAKLAVIGDGDLVLNELDRLGNPRPVGYYHYTGFTFANLDFVMTLIEYMWDSSGIVESKSRELAIRYLNRALVSQYILPVRIVGVGLPIVLTLVAGIVFNYIRYLRFGR